MPPSPEDRPDDGFRRLAEQALAAVVGDPVPVDPDDAADATTARRVAAVVDAITTAGQAGRP